MSKTLYKPNFSNISCVHRQHFYKDAKKSYSEFLLLDTKVNEV